MARLLAIDWDDHEARYVVAHTRGEQLAIEAAGSIALNAADAESAAGRQVGAALESHLAAQKLGRIRTLVAVDRGQVELLSLTLPPSADSELPEIVRNQAARQSNMADDTLLDFVPTNDDPAQPRTVSAVALSRERLERIQAICTAAGVTPDVLALRPYAAAALFAKSTAEPLGASLLVNVFVHEIDLSVVSRGKIVLWRTLRQSNVSHDPTPAKKLIAEINRTLVVAGSQLNGETIDSAFLFGGLDEHPVLLEQLRAELPVNVTLINPFADIAKTLADPPQNEGRFGALLGMLTVEARQLSHDIDFLHPRKTPDPPNRRRTITLAASAAALLVLLVGYHAWSTVAEVSAKNESLQQELTRLDDQFKQAGKRQKVIQAIRDWGESDVNWLDELRDLSLRFPSGRDVVLLRMGMSHSRNLGGNIDMVGVVRDPVIVSRIENSVRDKYHQISSRHVQERERDTSYAWHFEAQLVVAPRDAKHYVSHLPVRGNAIEREPAGLKKTPDKPKPSQQSAKTQR